MKSTGSPYFFNMTKSENHETAKGIRVSVIAECHSGNYKGVLVGLLFAGTDTENDGNGNLEGLCVSGNASVIDDNLNGVSIGGVASYVKNRLNGVSYGTLFNHAGSNGKIAIQIGAINNISKYDNSGIVIQIGLYNKIAKQTIPLINIKGLSKLFKKSK